MSGPSFVVLPVSGDNGQHPNQETAEIASTIQHALYERAHPEPERPGPLKQILAEHPDSLYKYINWEDPIQTLGLYIGALSILFGAHYLPLTQVALKAGVTTLGIVSIAEFASRSFGADSLSTRLRPKEYKKIPESALNATLKDIHDLIQYAVVQAQRVVFGQDLVKTFAAFLILTTLHWLIKIVPLFWLTAIGMTSIFVAPLVSSLQDRREFANAAAEKGRVLAQNGKVKAADLSSKGKQTAAGLSAQARVTASDMSETTVENIRKLPQMGMNVVNGAAGVATSAFGDAKEYTSTSPSNDIDRNLDGNQYITSGAAKEVSHLSSNASETAKQIAPEINADRQPVSHHPQNAVSSLPAQIGCKEIDSVAGTDFKYVAPGNVAATQGILD